MNIEGNCKMFMDFCKVNRALVLLKAFVYHQCHNVPFCLALKKLVILFCQTYQVKKKTQSDGPVVKKTRHETSEVDPCLPDSLLAQHIGELFAYVDSSVTYMDLCGSVGRDILGFTVEKTLVRDTFHDHLSHTHTVIYFISSDGFFRMIFLGKYLGHLFQNMNFHIKSSSN